MLIPPPTPTPRALFARPWLPLLLLLLAAFFTALPLHASAQSSPELDRQFFNYTLEKPRILEIGVLYPFTSRSDCAAVNLAIHQANSNPDLLSGYTLVPVFRDSGVHTDDHRQVLRATEELLNLDRKRGRRVSMLLGPLTDSWVSAALQLQSAHAVRTPLLSSYAVAGRLSNSDLYPSFVRVSPSDMEQGTSLAFLVRAMGWKRVATLSSANKDDGMLRQFLSVCHYLQIDVIQSQTMLAMGEQTDARVQLDLIKNSGARVILFDMNYLEAPTVFRQAIAAGITAPPYTVIGTWQWLRSETVVNDVSLHPLIQGAIGLLFARPQPARWEAYKTKFPVASQISMDFVRNITTPSRGSGITFDLATVAIKALDSLIRLRSGDPQQITEEAHRRMNEAIYKNVHTLEFDTWENRGESFPTPSTPQEKPSADAPPYFYTPTDQDDLELYKIILNTTHLGISGRLEFNANGDRQGRFEIVNVHPAGAIVYVGTIFNGMSSYAVLANASQQIDHGHSWPRIVPSQTSSAYEAIAKAGGTIDIDWANLHWPGHRSSVPPDAPLTVYKLQRVSTPARAVIAVLACLFLGVIIGSFVFLHTHRNHSSIRYHTGFLLLSTLFGCSLLVLAILFAGHSSDETGERQFITLDLVRIILLCYGTTLLPCSFIAMTIDSLLTERKRASQRNHYGTLDTSLSILSKFTPVKKRAHFLAACLLIDTIMLIFLNILAPLQRNVDTQTESLVDSYGSDIILVRVYEIVRSDNTVLWLLTLALWKVVTLMLGLYLSLQVRTNEYARMASNAWIGFFTYAVISCTVLPLNFLIDKQVDASYLITTLAILVLVGVTLCLHFLPIVQDVYFNNSSKLWVRGRSNVIIGGQSINWLHDDLLFVLNSQLQFHEISSNFAKMLGLLPKEIHREHVSKFIHEQERDLITKQLHLFMSSATRQLTIKAKSSISAEGQLDTRSMDHTSNHLCRRKRFHLPAEPTSPSCNTPNSSLSDHHHRHHHHRHHSSHNHSNTPSQLYPGAGGKVTHSGESFDEFQMHSFTARFLCLSGEVKWLECKLSLSDPDYTHKQLQLFGSARDITRQKLIEEEMKRNEDAAIASSKAKALFVANLSHELRTPLNGISGMTRFLAETKLDYVQRDYVSTIQSCSSHLLTIINDVLDFSKIESGALDLERIPCVLHELIEESIELSYVKEKSSQLDVVYFIDSDCPPIILTDPVRLKQILVNLVSNSLKFSSHGQVEVHVTVERQPDRLSTAQEIQAMKQGNHRTSFSQKKILHDTRAADSQQRPQGPCVDETKKNSLQVSVDPPCPAPIQTVCVPSTHSRRDSLSSIVTVNWRSQSDSDNKQENVEEDRRNGSGEFAHHLIVSPSGFARDPLGPSVSLQLGRCATEPAAPSSRRKAHTGLARHSANPRSSTSRFALSVDSMEEWTPLGATPRTSHASIQAHQPVVDGSNANPGSSPDKGFPTDYGACPDIVLRFEVRDTGIGIPANKLNRLFKAFSQISNETTRQYGGTGLGLSIAQALAKAMGNKCMQVQSTEGVGSNFSFNVCTQIVSHEALLATRPNTFSPVPATHPLAQHDANSASALIQAANQYIYCPLEYSGLRGKSLLLIHSNVVTCDSLLEETLKLGMKPVALSNLDKLINSLPNDLDAFDVILINDLLIMQNGQVNIRGADLAVRIHHSFPSVPIALMQTKQSNTHEHTIMEEAECEPVPQRKSTLNEWKPFKLFKPIKLAALAEVILDMLQSEQEPPQANHQQQAPLPDHMDNSPLTIASCSLPASSSELGHAVSAPASALEERRRGVAAPVAPMQPTTPAPEVLQGAVVPLRHTPRSLALAHSVSSHSLSSSPTDTPPVTRRLIKHKQATLNGNTAAQYPLRILVAEDVKINQQVIVGVLSRMGYKNPAVIVVENGLKALEAVQAATNKLFEHYLKNSNNNQSNNNNINNSNPPAPPVDTIPESSDPSRVSVSSTSAISGNLHTVTTKQLMDPNYSNNPSPYTTPLVTQRTLLHANTHAQALARSTRDSILTREEMAVSSSVDSDSSIPLHPIHSLLLTIPNIPSSIPSHPATLITPVRTADPPIGVCNVSHLSLPPFEEEPFSIVLMDVQMPSMDGIESTQKIREFLREQPFHLLPPALAARYSHPIIMAMTANALASDKQKCMEAGMDDFISKPLQFQALANKLVHWGQHINKLQKAVANEQLAPFHPHPQTSVDVHPSSQVI